MRKTLATLVLIVAACASVANAQGAKPNTSQPSAEVLLQQRVAALEKEVRSLKAELAALRAQIERSKSPPVVSERASKSSGRPSQADIQTCINPSSVDFLHYNGPIINVEYGTTFSSHGERGNPPKGTTIYPVKVRFQLSNSKTTLHLFVDSFGLWQCSVAGT